MVSGSVLLILYELPNTSIERASFSGRAALTPSGTRKAAGAVIMRSFYVGWRAVIWSMRLNEFRLGPNSGILSRRYFCKRPTK
jgi:hypothetical protein